MEIKVVNNGDEDKGEVGPLTDSSGVEHWLIVECVFNYMNNWNYYKGGNAEIKSEPGQNYSLIREVLDFINGRPNNFNA